MNIWMAWGLLVAAAASHAQAPVDNARTAQNTMQRDQFKAGATYRELQQAEYASRQVEQDFRQAEDDYKAARARAEEFRQKYVSVKKKYDAAKAKEAQARKAYEGAVNAVDADMHKAAKK